MRRTYRFWSAIVTDQTVEQSFMIMLKTSGVLAYGRVITPSTTYKFSVFCRKLPLCAPPEKVYVVYMFLLEINTQTSGLLFLQEMVNVSSSSTHSPFSYNGAYATKLESGATAVVAPESAFRELWLALNSKEMTR